MLLFMPADFPVLILFFYIKTLVFIFSCINFKFWVISILHNFK